MTPFCIDGMIEGDYYLAYQCVSSRKLLAVGEYRKKAHCLVGATAYQVFSDDKDVFTVHPRIFGLHGEQLEIFKLDKDEILRHIVSENI